MPTMFPTARPPRDDDPNRRINYWQPGDPTPKTAIVSFAMFLIIAVLMVVSGVFMLFPRVQPSDGSTPDPELVNFITRNMRILGAINIALGATIGWMSTGIRDGYRGRRRWVLWLSMVAMFFMLAGWVIRMTGAGQAVLALGLAIACLLAFRPSANPFFDAGHRLNSQAGQPDGDGTLPGDQLRG